MNYKLSMDKALAQVKRHHPDYTLEEQLEAASDLLHDWIRDAAEEREGIQDTECIASCDQGTGEGRYHGVIK